MRWRSLQVALHLAGAQIEIAVLEPQVFVHLRVVEREGRHVGLVQDRQFAGDDLDLAGGQLRVFGAGQARGDLCR